MTHGLADVKPVSAAPVRRADEQAAALRRPPSWAGASRAAASGRLVLMLPWATMVERGTGTERVGDAGSVIHQRTSAPDSMRKIQT